MPMILNEEQNMLKDTAKAFCGTNAPISQLRKLRDEDSADGFDRGTWSKMVELGWSGIPWPEEYGGLAFGYKGLGVVTEETGRTLAASPLISTVWACGTAINLAGSQDQKQELLGRIASGDLIVALALEESHRHDPYHVESKAREKEGVYKISGKKTFVLDGHVADKLIVVTRTSGKKDSRDGLTLFLIDRKTKGVKVTRTKMADSRNAANIQFRGVTATRDQMLGPIGGGGRHSRTHARRRAHRSRRRDARFRPKSVSTARSSI